MIDVRQLVISGATMQPLAEFFSSSSSSPLSSPLHSVESYNEATRGLYTPSLGIGNYRANRRRSQ